MRMPTRLNITWQDDRTIKIETDAGQQTRLPALRRRRGARRSARCRATRWRSGSRRRSPAAAAVQPQIPRFGNLRVATTNLTAGWLRKNGVPYSENATVTEYFDRFKAPNNDEWLVVTTIVSDPKYLNQDFVTSTHFKKEPNGAKWARRRARPSKACRRV